VRENRFHLDKHISQDAQGKVRRAQWTVTDRVSYFWCGQQFLHDPGADWSEWLAQQWEQLIALGSDSGLTKAA
jgi:hypothetical protein